MITSKDDEDCATSRGERGKERVLGCIVSEFGRKICVFRGNFLCNFFSAENIFSIARLVQSHFDS